MSDQADLDALARELEQARATIAQRDALIVRCVAERDHLQQVNANLAKSVNSLSHRCETQENDVVDLELQVRKLISAQTSMDAGYRQMVQEREAQIEALEVEVAELEREIWVDRVRV
jgi:chorismate mutase